MDDVGVKAQLREVKEMAKEELTFREFLRMFFRKGAEEALEHIKRKEMLSNDQIDELKNAILRHYQVWHLIDRAREQFSANIDENWALALISSTLIENVVKDSLQKLGQTPDEGRGIRCL